MSQPPCLMGRAGPSRHGLAFSKTARHSNNQLLRYNRNCCHWHLRQTRPKRGNLSSTLIHPGTAVSLPRGAYIQTCPGLQTPRPALSVHGLRCEQTERKQCAKLSRYRHAPQVPIKRLRRRVCQTAQPTHRKQCSAALCAMLRAHRMYKGRARS